MEVSVPEGQTATLSCTFSADFSNVFIYWYRQYPGEPPLYTRRHDYDGETFSAEFAKQRFSTTLDTNTKSSSVTVRSVALSDTATYYCAITAYDEGGETVKKKVLYFRISCDRFLQENNTSGHIIWFGTRDLKHLSGWWKANLKDDGHFYVAQLQHSLTQTSPQ
uniref:Ig-like domain-containing protein n=1 Tax=Callorhinchus milii TaxID=7868 RepID=A0A4W3GQ31_CALMI